MNYRLSTLFERKSYAADATEPIDITLTDPISALVIEHMVLNGTDASMKAHPLACVTKIEIVDGSDVLFSLNGREADAVDWYQDGKIRSPYNFALNGLSTQRVVGINFGRKLWDPELAFVPKNFKNPQLKISLDVDAGGMSPSTNQLKVWAAVFDEKAVSPIGFLMHKEIKDYSLTSGGHEYTDLPTDYPYRKLFIRQQSEGYEPTFQLSNFKLSENFDKKIVFNHFTEDIRRVIAPSYAPYRESWYFIGGAGNFYLMCTPTERVTAHANEWGESPTGASIALYDGDGGRLKTKSSVTPGNVQITVEGWLPHGVWEIPFGDPNDMDDWYDVTLIDNLRLDITAGAYSATTPKAQIFLQQLRKY